MFYNTQFNADLSHWNPLSLGSIDLIFDKCKVPIPYWTKIENQSDRIITIAIEIYHTQKHLNDSIQSSDKNIKILKI